MVVHHSALSGALPPGLAALLALIAIVLYVFILVQFITDLYKPERRVYGGDKTVWLFIMIFGSVLGCMAYLLFGRES